MRAGIVVVLAVNPRVFHLPPHVSLLMGAVSHLSPAILSA